MRLPLVGQVVGRWETDPLWARFYDATVGNPRVGDPLLRLATRSDHSPLRTSSVALADLGPGSRVLDVPCGGGAGVRGLRPGQGVDYVAADISAAMLRRTTRVAEACGVADQVTTRETDVAALPDETGTFDLVLTFTGLHCVDDPRAAVTEMTRVLAPGGRIVGSTLLADVGLRYEAGRRFGRAIDILGPMCTRSELYGWLRAGSIERLTLSNAGPLVYFRGTKA